MTHGLANVFVNNQRVEDLDDPELKVRDIIAAYGRDPTRCVVYRLSSDDEAEGEPLDLEDRVDLAQIPGNLYLRCETRRSEATAPLPDARLSETEQVPAYEGALGDIETEQTLDAEEREQEETVSPGTGRHAKGDPTGHQFYDRDAEPNWGRREQGPGSANVSSEASQATSALGSEVRPPRVARIPSARSTGSRTRRRTEGTSSASSTRTSLSRRKAKEASTTRRSGR